MIFSPEDVSFTTLNVCTFVYASGRHDIPLKNDGRTLVDHHQNRVQSIFMVLYVDVPVVDITRDQVTAVFAASDADILWHFVPPADVDLSGVLAGELRAGVLVRYIPLASISFTPLAVRPGSGRSSSPACRRVHNAAISSRFAAIVTNGRIWNAHSRPVRLIPST
jgi:hypothetical protein